MTRQISTKVSRF